MRCSSDVTYEGFAQAGPTITDGVGFADRMNSLPKYVVSTTLKNGTWNNTTIIASNVVDEVRALKQMRGQAILVGGSGMLVDTLTRHDLVDEYRLMVFPVVLGKGRRLFVDGGEAKTFEARSVAASLTAACLTVSSSPCWPVYRRRQSR